MPTGNFMEIRLITPMPAYHTITTAMQSETARLAEGVIGVPTISTNKILFMQFVLLDVIWYGVHMEHVINTPTDCCISQIPR